MDFNSWLIEFLNLVNRVFCKIVRGVDRGWQLKGITLGVTANQPYATREGSAR